MSDFTYTEIVANFCILTGWDREVCEIAAVAKSGDKYRIYTNDGSIFTYDPVKDCLVD